jgi:hypothetical protein
MLLRSIYQQVKPSIENEHILIYVQVASFEFLCSRMEENDISLASFATQ